MSVGEPGRCSLFIQSMCLPLSSYLTRNCQKTPIESQLLSSLLTFTTTHGGLDFLSAFRPSFSFRFRMLEPNIGSLRGSVHYKVKERRTDYLPAKSQTKGVLTVSEQLHNSVMKWHNFCFSLCIQIQPYKFAYIKFIHLPKTWVERVSLAPCLPGCKCPTLTEVQKRLLP